MQQKKSNTIVIAIDGHSSTGKSTVAKALSDRLGFTYIDTGAMYRAVTLFAMQNGIISNGILDQARLEEQIGRIGISFAETQPGSAPQIHLNSRCVENDIRSLEVASYVSTVSAIKSVREKLVSLQRDMAASGSIILDGRDIGTVVFPGADLKIFMTAPVDIRAKRRYDELIAKGSDVAYQDVYDNVAERDRQDENRAESPLRKAHDALVLDNSAMCKDEQLVWILNKMQEKGLVAGFL
jgi:CMP/dCMP kinase